MSVTLRKEASVDSQANGDCSTLSGARCQQERAWRNGPDQMPPSTHQIDDKARAAAGSNTRSRCAAARRGEHSNTAYILQLMALHACTAALSRKQQASSHTRTDWLRW